MYIYIYISNCPSPLSHVSHHNLPPRQSKNLHVGFLNDTHCPEKKCSQCFSGRSRGGGSYTAHYCAHAYNLSKILGDNDARPRSSNVFSARCHAIDLHFFCFLFFSFPLSLLFFQKKARDRLSSTVPLDANPATEPPSNSAPDDPRSYSRGSSTHRASFSPIVSLLRPSFPGRPRSNDFFLPPCLSLCSRLPLSVSLEHPRSTVRPRRWTGEDWRFAIAATCSTASKAPK